MPIDSKQARDLVAVLQEAKQHIDPRLHEMTRYGGGGGGRFGGRGFGRGGGYRKHHIYKPIYHVEFANNRIRRWQRW